MLHRLIALALAGALSLGLISPSFAAQGTGCMPTTGTVSGLTFAQDVNAAIAALISSNSGSSSPTTDCSVAAIKGQVWLDTSVTPNALRQYDGSSTWVPVGYLDATNHLWSPPIGGGTATLASATTTDLWSSVASSITVSGTTTVTALASASAVPGTVKLVTVTGIFTLTYNATSLILPGASNITTAVGDQFFVKALTSTNVAVLGYTRADGSSLVNPSVPLGTVLYGDYGTIPVKTVYGMGQALSRASYPAFLAAVTRAQTGTLTSGNNTITSVGNTDGLGAGMPLEGTGIQAGTTISSVTVSTIVMSQTATANGSQAVTAFLTGYGASGNSTTVGVKDCRGRTLAGRDAPLGSAAGRLTSSFFGAGANVINGATALTESRTLLTANLPAYTPAGTFSASLTSGNVGIQALGPYTITFGGGGQTLMGGGGGTTVSGSVSGSIVGAAQGGSSTAFGISPPTSIAECVQVVLP